MYSPVRLDCMRVVPLDRKINPRYSVFIFIFHSWIYLVDKVLSSFIKSNLLHARFACAQTYLDWRTLVKKICQNTDLFLFLFFGLQDNGILNSWGAVFQRAIYVSPTFLKHNYAEKKMQAHAKTIIRTCKNHDPNMQEVVCYEAARNFVYQIYSRVKNKNKNPIARVDFSIQWHHSHADPIWPDCTFMWSVR